MKIAINEATTMPYPLEADIIAAGKVGFDGIELWWDKVKTFMEKGTTLDIKELLEKSGVKPIGLCPFLVSPFRNTESLRNEFLYALKVAREIGCPMLVVCPDFRQITLSKEESLTMHGKEFAWYAEHAVEFGIKLAIEPIGRHTLVPGPMEALDVIERAGSPNNLGLLVDTFHYMRSEITKETIKKIPVERLFVVHINDSESGTIDELQDHNRLYPTMGFIDLKSNLEALSFIGYDGYISVELFCPELWEEAIDRICERAYQSAKAFLELNLSSQ